MERRVRQLSKQQQQIFWQLFWGKSAFRYKMGVSLQQWRVAVGTFAGRIASSSWKPKSGGLKVKVRGKPFTRPPDRGGMLGKCLVVNVVIMIMVVETLMTVNTVSPSNLTTVQAQTSQHGTLLHDGVEVSDQWTAGQIRRLLLLISMDVESNPGPEVSGDLSQEDRMVEGLAELMSQTPTPAIRNVLACWSPTSSQSDILKGFDKYNKPHIVDTLTWLWNVDVSTIKGNKDVLLKDLLTAT